MNDSMVLKVIQGKSLIEGMTVHSRNAKSGNTYVSIYVN